MQDGMLMSTSKHTRGVPVQGGLEKLQLLGHVVRKQSENRSTSMFWLGSVQPMHPPSDVLPLLAAKSWWKEWVRLIFASLLRSLIWFINCVAIVIKQYRVTGHDKMPDRLSITLKA
jgi:hypothetical protein